MQLRNINKKYKDKVVFNDLNLEITKPGVYGIIGLSGSGKTTLLNMLYGIDTNFEGEYTIDSKKLKELKILNEYNDNISLVFQDTKLLENLSGYDNLMLANKTNSDIDKLLNKFGILDLRDVEVKYYSGGEKQRLAIARALINEPKIILLDEPTAALDDRNTKFVLDTIKNLGTDKIIVVISHDERIIDHIDNLYELKDQNITLIKSVENSNDNITLKEVKKNKNKISKVAFKNFKANKKGLIPTALALIVATIIFMMMSFLLVPVIYTAFAEFGTNGETSAYYHDIDHNNACFLEDGSLNREEVTGYCDITEEQLMTLESNENVLEVQPKYNITQTMYLSAGIDTTINQTILDNFGYDENSVEAKQSVGAPLHIYANVNPNDMNGINLNESNVIGNVPAKPGEVAISNTMAMILFDTTNYNEVIGQKVTLDFIINEYITEEEQNKLIAEANLNDQEVIYPSKEFSKTFTITAVYENKSSSFQKANFENELQNAQEETDYVYTVNDTFTAYITPYHDLTDDQKEQFIEIYNYANGTKYTTSNFSTGYTNIVVVLPYDESMQETYQAKIAEVFGVESGDIYVSNMTYEMLFLAIGLFLVGFLVLAMFIAIAIMCLNLMNLKMRKDEFAKYYLIGFNNRQVLSSVALEMLYLNLIVIPIGIILSLILFKFGFDAILSSVGLVVLITIMIVIFINALILLWYYFANRRKKILKNLREAK